LALPTEAKVIGAASLREAFAAAQFAEFDALHHLKPSGTPALYWEDGAEAGIPSRHVFERRDVPLSRRRWQFDVRQEHHAPLDREEG
jgi:hypothetical protein